MANTPTPNRSQVRVLSDGRECFFDFTKPPGRMSVIEQVWPQPGFKLRLRFADGTVGEADLSQIADSSPLAKKAWVDNSLFAEVAVHEGGGGVVWGDEDFDLSSNNLYMRVTGRTLEEMYPQLQFLD